MSTGIKISSITHEPINDKTPFIRISSYAISDFLYKKYSNDIMTIFGINIDKVNNFLTSKKISNIFVPVSDMMILNSSTNSTPQILLVNERILISRRPIIYDKIMRFGKGFLWKPISISFPLLYVGIGLIYSVKKPINGCRMIDANFLTNADDIPNNLTSNHIVMSNEYGMFVQDYDERKTIDIQKLLMLSMDIKTETLIDRDKIISYNDIYERPKPRVLQDGRVEIGTQCLDSLQGSLDLKDCVDVQGQQWQFSDGRIINRETGKCLTSPQNDTFETVSCESNSSGIFEDNENPDVKYPRWNKKFGKNVVLVSAENPWYINTNTTTPAILDSHTQTMNPEYTDYSKNYASVPVKHHLDPLPTQPETGVEYFEPTSGASDELIKKSKKTNIINLFNVCICILFLIIFLQIYFMVRNN